MEYTNIFTYTVVRFAIIGVVNTLVGYFLGVIFYFWLFDQLDSYFISVLSGFTSIAFSLMLQRKFVFSSQGSLRGDLIRGGLVYGVLVLVAALTFKLLIDTKGLDIYIAQAIILGQSWVFSYFLLKKFAFPNRVNNYD